MRRMQNTVQRLRGNEDETGLLGEHAQKPEERQRRVKANDLSGVHQSTMLTAEPRLHHLSQLPLEHMHQPYMLNSTRAQVTISKLQSRAGDVAVRQLQLFL